MFEYKIIPITVEKILNDFIDIYPYFKDINNHCLIYSNSKLAYIKDENNNTIGSVLFREYNEFPYIWELGHIKIKEDYRNKHLASNLLDNIKVYIKQNNGKKIMVHVSDTNKIAQQFYLKNKFIKEATIKNMKLGKEDLHLFTLDI